MGVQPQKSATLSPQPGGKPRKFIRTCGGTGKKKYLLLVLFRSELRARFTLGYCNYNDNKYREASPYSWHLKIKFRRFYGLFTKVEVIIKEVQTVRL